MFKEYKPSEKCYISDLLQINKIIAAAPCGTERDINQQENDLYKTISVASISSTLGFSDTAWLEMFIGIMFNLVGCYTSFLLIFSLNWIEFT